MPFPGVRPRYSPLFTDVKMMQAPGGVVPSLGCFLLPPVLLESVGVRDRPSKETEEAGFGACFPRDYTRRSNFGLLQEKGTRIFANETQKNLKMWQTEAEMASEECISPGEVPLMIPSGRCSRLSPDRNRSPAPSIVERFSLAFLNRTRALPGTPRTWIVFAGVLGISLPKVIK